MFQTWFSASAIILFVYLLFTAAMMAAWHLLRLEKIRLTERKKSVSLLIPFRNEAPVIDALAESLKNIDYPPSQLEIILIDDHSEDDTASRLQQLIPSLPFHTRLLSLEDGKEGKREALRKGTQAASNEILAFTDADCRLHPGWITTMVSVMNDKTRMICGPVFTQDEGFLTGKLQSLEIASVMAVTAGMAWWKMPVMANGANLFTYREDFTEYLQQYKPPSASGDDMWFLLYMKKKGRGIIRFILQKQAAVFTHAKPTLGELIQQRKRWAGKSRFYRDPALVFTSLLIALMNVSVLAGLLFTGCDSRILYGLLVLILSKAIADFTLVSGPLFFCRTKKLFVLIPLLEIIYPLYTLILGLMILKKKHRWKGREFSA